MDASMINKIQKAGEYASQPERATFDSLVVDFNGANSSHRVRLDNDGWACTCSGFSHYQSARISWLWRYCSNPC